MKPLQFFKRKGQPEPEPADFLGHLTRAYTNFNEDTRLASQSGQVEFLTTMRYIERYLEPGMRVLEIGAATGRYSLAIARKGYDVTAIELVQHNIDVFRKKMQPEDKVDLQQGNALDLSRFADGSFDIALLLGPMYHLHTQEDQSRALREALRVTKPGGLLFAAYVITDMVLHTEGFLKGKLDHFITEHQMDLETFRHEPSPDPKELFNICRREDIDALMAPLPCTRLHYVATDGLYDYMREAIDKMTPERFDQYMRYRFFLCEREDMAGATNHSLDILRKDENHA